MADAGSYIALSYARGSEFPQRPIAINGAEFFVRQNLFDFLAVARDQPQEILFWIDQICIDQFSIAERSHQVPLMSRTYKDARHVIAWLGAEGNDSDMAITYIERLPRDFPEMLSGVDWRRSKSRNPPQVAWVTQEHVATCA